MMKRLTSGNSKKYRRRKRIGFLAAGLCLSGLSIWRLAGIDAESAQGAKIYHRMEQDALKHTVVRTEQEKGSKDAEPETSFDYRTVRIDFDVLRERNEDIAGWILFDNNGISYPVLQGEDNEKYLYLAADKTEHAAGSIFIDVCCASDFMDSHTIIYGHNMKDLSMFGKLKNYRLSKGYYEENKYFTIYTPQKMLRYVIFSWYEAAEDDPVYQAGFTDEAAFGAFAEELGKRGIFDTGITAGMGDRVVTLSTCSTKNKRFVVHGKLIEAAFSAAFTNEQQRANIVTIQQVCAFTAQTVRK